MAAAEPVAPAMNAWQKPLFTGRKPEAVATPAPAPVMPSVVETPAEVETPPPVKNAWGRSSSTAARVTGDWGPTLQEANKLSPAEKRELKLQQLKRQEIVSSGSTSRLGASAAGSGSAAGAKGKRKEGKGKKKADKGDKDKTFAGGRKKNRRNKGSAAGKNNHGGNMMVGPGGMNPAFGVPTGIGAGSLAFPPGMPGMPGMPPVPPMPFYAAYGPAGVFVPASNENRTMLAASAVRAIEMTFSPNHLCTDEFLRQHMDVAGYVPVALVANYSHVAQYGALYEDLLAGLANSELLQLDAENETVRLRENWEQWLFPDGKGGMGCPRYVKVSPVPPTDQDASGSTADGDAKGKGDEEEEEEEEQDDDSNGSKKTEEASGDSGDSCDASESSSNECADPVVS
uniref:HTH La-type RNA-binding domain-containing protein n=1 Tax=Pinguiococcus pyrenoidosus TaxID=172671 RepID=A0A7R9U3W9_9STRA